MELDNYYNTLIKSLQADQLYSLISNETTEQIAIRLREELYEAYLEVVNKL